MENMNYFLIKGPEPAENRAITMERNERLKKKQQSKPKQRTLILWKEGSLFYNIHLETEKIVFCIKLVKEAG